MNNFEKKFMFFISVWLLICPAWVKAQNDEGEIQALKLQFDNFIKAYSKVEQTKDKQSVLKYMFRDVTATLVSFDMSKNMEVRNTDLRSFESHLDELITNKEMEIKYQVSGILRTYINNNKNGVLVYTVDYEIKKSGYQWSKGTETVTLTYKKIEGQWLIIQYSVVAIEDEKFRGACLCEVFADETGEYVSKLMIPTGRSYVSELNYFNFYEEKGERYIKADAYVYRWAKTGEIWRQPEGAEVNEVKIGGAYSGDKREAMVVILGRHLYKENCAQTKLSTK